MSRNLIPGRILVVDDVSKDVADIVTSLREEGYGVIYREGPTDDIGELSNIRLVILDLDLKGPGPDVDFEQPALVLIRLIEGGNGFFLLAVWSRHVTNDEMDDEQEWLLELKAAYAEQTDRVFPSMLLMPFRKRPEQKELLDRIEKWVRDTPSAGLVFEWERLLNEARDWATSDILDLDGGSLTNLVKALRGEVEQGANRELVQLFNRILLRHMIGGELTEIGALMSRLEGGGRIGADWYARFHCLQAYYPPSEVEPVWTGDILQTGEDEYRKAYAVVITSQCDLAQGKVDRIKVAYAMKVDDSLERTEQAFKTVRPGKLFRQDERLSGKASLFLKGIAGQGSLPERFYVLRFIQGDELCFHLLVDLHNVHSVPLVDVEHDWKQKRICRLDSPYIEDLLQRYAALSARVGVPGIPDEVCKAEVERLSGK